MRVLNGSELFLVPNNESVRRGTHTPIDGLSVVDSSRVPGHAAATRRHQSCLPHKALPSAHSTPAGQDGGPGGTPPTNAPPRRTGPRVAADLPTTWGV